MSKTFITNFETLATTPLRRDALTIAEAAYKAIDTTLVIENNVYIIGCDLHIGKFTYNISTFEHIFLIGFGKASCPAIAAIETILQDKVSEGVVIDKTHGKCLRSKVYKGEHPLSTPFNVEISGNVVSLAEKATEKDLVIVVVSGGGSALLCWPMSECVQGNDLYKKFLSTGGKISELNTIRKHISSLKGGGLAKMLYPATVASLILSDVPGDAYEHVASGPTYKDTTTVADAEAILTKYAIEHTYSFEETPKEDIYFEKVTNIPLISNVHAVMGMQKKAEELGYKVTVLSTEEYRDSPLVVSDLKKTLTPRSVIITAGEPSVVVVHPGGRGGRNEFAAGIALNLVDDEEVFISFATDGIDNHSLAAGALIDKGVVAQAAQAGISIQEYIDNGKQDELFEELGVQIITGPTGSNVSDCIMYIKG